MIALYRVTMRHDDGITRFRITASSPESAAKQMCAMEDAPARAVESVVLLRVIHSS